MVHSNNGWLVTRQEPLQPPPHVMLYTTDTLPYPKRPWLAQPAGAPAARLCPRTISLRKPAAKPGLVATLLKKQMDTQEPGCASPQLPPSCSSERAALPCWGTATFLGCWQTRLGRAQRQGSGPNSPPVNNGLERQCRRGRAGFFPPEKDVT